MSHSSAVHRIDIDSWRSSLPLDTDAQPELVASSGASRRRARHPHQQPGFSAAASSRPRYASSDEGEVDSETGEVRPKGSKKHEADRLVDSTLDLLSSVWFPVPSSPFSSEASSYVDSDSEADKDAVPLRTFVNEILRRSRSSCATLRAARWYLERAGSVLPPAEHRTSTLACPRRTFLSSLVLANKFLHDKVYSNRAWSKVSGLEVTEISQGESALGDLLGWSLWVDREPNQYDYSTHDANAPPLVPLASTLSRAQRATSVPAVQVSEPVVPSISTVLGGTANAPPAGLLPPPPPAACSSFASPEVVYHPPRQELVAERSVFTELSGLSIASTEEEGASSADNSSSTGSSPRLSDIDDVVLVALAEDVQDEETVDREDVDERERDLPPRKRQRRGDFGGSYHGNHGDSFSGWVLVEQTLACEPGVAS